MCHVSCIVFGVNNFSEAEIENKRIIEIGSYQVNGSIRPIFEKYHPSEYIGVDIESGPGVDIICEAEYLTDKFGTECFNVVICTEMLEHVRDWRTTIKNIKELCKQDGLIFISTRSFGFPYHAYPNDYWRYELNDMKEIFSDCEIIILESDLQEPGVFLKVRKPANFAENDLSEISLYSIAANKRIKELNNKHFRNFNYIKLVAKNILWKFIFN